MVNIAYLAQINECSEEEAQRRWDANELFAPAGGVKAICTGHHTHKPAFIGWVRLGISKDGTYSIGMSEAGNAKNIQNSSGLQGDGQKEQGNLWPLYPADYGETEPAPGTSMYSYRFACRRCRRDVQISREKLGHAVQTMLVNEVKYFDLSLLPFA